MDSKQRETVIKAIPWVKSIDGERPSCDGIKWGMVALKHIYEMYGNPPEGIPEKAHCKNRARWHFRALPSSYARTGNYCTSHLLASGLFHDDKETKRTDKWYDEWKKEHGND
jgi:hypothetical protein